MDLAESELACLDLITKFVQALDKVFVDASEVDVCMNFQRVNLFIDEWIVNGNVALFSEKSMVEKFRLVK